MIKKLVEFWDNSLFVKLNATVSAVAVILFIIVYLMMRFEALALSKYVARQLSSAAVDALIAGAKHDSSDENLQRLVPELALNESLRSIYLIDLSTGFIVASSMPEKVGSYDAQYSSAGLATANKESKTLLTLNTEEGYIDVKIRFAIPPNDVMQARNLLAVVRFMGSGSAGLPSNAIWFSEWLVFLALISLLLAFWGAQRWILKGRLEEIKRLIEHEMDSVGYIPQVQARGDELSQIKYRFVDLIWGRKQAEAETERALQIAEKSSRAKDDFLANMSHELRTPLNSVIGFSRRIIKTQKNLDDSQLKSMNVILNNGIHLLGLINDILDLSKIDAGKMELKLQTIELGPFIRSWLHEFETQANEKGLEFSYQISDGLFARVDELRLRQILLNLVSNAVKYTQKGGIEIRLHLGEDQQIKLEVEDSGFGIREFDQQRLFKRFEQFDDNSRFQVGHGTGLGLSIVNEFTKLLGGSVSLESEYGRGSCFTVSLPLQKVRMS